jgi:type IV pilus assembly protein PilO
MGNIDFRDPNVQIAGMVVIISLTFAYVFFLSPIIPFGYKPRTAEIAALEVEYEKLSADLMKAKQAASRLPQVKKEYEQITSQWDEAKTLLPTEKEMAELLSQVTVAGRRSGVEFLLFQPKPPTPREIYMENPIEVTVQGGYHDIGVFLGRVSNLPRIINVKSIDLKNVANPSGSELPDVVEANLSLMAYTLLSADQRAAAATPTPAPRPNARTRGGMPGGH